MHFVYVNSASFITWLNTLNSRV